MNSPIANAADCAGSRLVSYKRLAARGFFPSRVYICIHVSLNAFQEQPLERVRSTFELAV